MGFHHVFPDSPKVTWTCWLLSELWFTRRHACLTSLPSARLSVKPLHGLIRFKSCSRWKRWLFNPVRWRVLVQNGQCFKAPVCKRGYGCTPFLRGTHPKTEWWNLPNFRWKRNFLFETAFNLFGFHCRLGGLGPTAGKSCTFVVFWRVPLYPQLVYNCDFKCTWARFSSITAAMLAVQEWQMACQLFFCQRAALRLQHVTETPPVGFSNRIFVEFLLGTKNTPITFPKTKMTWCCGDLEIFDGLIQTYQSLQKCLSYWCYLESCRRLQ